MKSTTQIIITFCYVSGSIYPTVSLLVNNYHLLAIRVRRSFSVPKRNKRNQRENRFAWKRKKEIFACFALKWNIKNQKQIVQNETKKSKVKRKMWRKCKKTYLETKKHFMRNYAFFSLKRGKSVFFALLRSENI